MFIKNSQTIPPYDWIGYSADGSNTVRSSVQTQPINATSDQLTLMGITVQPDPAPLPPPPPPTLDQIYDLTIQTQQVLKAIVLALNDGTLPVGTNKTPAQLKAIVKARM